MSVNENAAGNSWKCVFHGNKKFSDIKFNESDFNDPQCAIGYDIETSTSSGKVLGLSISNHDEYGYFLPDLSFLPAGKKIAHNFKFECAVAKSNGIIIDHTHWEDTMIAAHLCGEMLLSLKDLSMMIFGEDISGYSDVVPKGSSLDCLSVSELANYSIPHAVMARRLWIYFEEQMKNDDVYKLYKRIEMPLVEVLVDMENTGAFIDVGKLSLINDSYTVKIKALKEALDYHTGYNGINFASTKQLRKLLYDEYHLKVHGGTPSGLPSTSAYCLGKLKGQHPVVDLLLAFRSVSKFQDTFIKNIFNSLDSDNFIHTDYTQTVASTGRLSSRKPNLQNIPKRKEDGKIIRTAFSAPPHWKLVIFDFSQIELRIVAWLSQDKSMMDAFKNGVDIHTKTAIEVFKDIKKRPYAKNYNFAVVYGAGGGLLSEMSGLPLKVSNEYLNVYFRVYPGIKAWSDVQRNIAQQCGFIRTYFGRKIPVINETGREAYTVPVNGPVQGTAAEIMKLSMRFVWYEIQRCGSMSKISMQIHDELVILVPEEEIPVITNIINMVPEYLLNFFPMRLPVEVKVGDNWGDAVVCR